MFIDFETPNIARETNGRFRFLTFPLAFEGEQGTIHSSRAALLTAAVSLTSFGYLMSFLLCFSLSHRHLLRESIFMYAIDFLSLSPGRMAGLNGVNVSRAHNRLILFRVVLTDIDYI